MTDKPTPIPDIFAVWFVEGRPTPDAWLWLKQVDKVLRINTEFIDTPPPPSTFDFIEEFSAVVPFPSDKDYLLSLKASVGRTITEVVTICTSGTCTVTVKTDTTALGGTANAASSTEQSQPHTTSNDWAIGEDLRFTVSANASCVDLTVTVKTVRTIGP